MTPDQYLAKRLRDERERLGIKVINLRHSLELANKMLAKHGLLGVICDEDARPSFREARAFLAKAWRIGGGKRR